MPSEFVFFAVISQDVQPGGKFKSMYYGSPSWSVNKFVLIKIIYICENILYSKRVGFFWGFSASLHSLTDCFS